MKSIFSRRASRRTFPSTRAVLLMFYSGVLVLAGFGVGYGQLPLFADSLLADRCGSAFSDGIRWIDDHSSGSLLFLSDIDPYHFLDKDRADCCSQAFAGCGGAGDEKGSFRLGAYCVVYDYYGNSSTSEGGSQKLKAAQLCMDNACPVTIGQPGNKKATTKIKIATTSSCSDSPNEGFSAEQGVSVSIGGKMFTSNANGVIEAELPNGTYKANAVWNDNILGFVKQNGLKLRGGEDGSITLTLSGQVDTYEFRMFTCDLNGLPRARAVISEVGGSIYVKSTRVEGPAYVGRQLRDGDIVRVTGTAKLNWLKGGTISFENPKGSAIIIIGPEKPEDRKNVPAPSYEPSAVEVLKGVVRFLIPSDPNADLPRDANGNIIKFGASAGKQRVYIKGTIFSLGYDDQTQVATVTVEKGVVFVVPQNSAYRAFDLEAGQEVQLSPTSVGQIKRVNIWTGIDKPVEQLIGCYKDTAAFDLNGYLERSILNTPQHCVQTCRSRGFKYAGVQYGESCLCGDSYGKYGLATNCDYKCTGDPGQICGGYAANSVYSTGISGNSSKSCGLGTEWNAVDGFGWNGRWVRRGNSNDFDAVWAKDGQVLQAVLSITTNGNSVNIQEQKGYINCAYQGTIGSDGKTVTGNYRCSLYPNVIYNWNAAILCSN